MEGNKRVLIGFCDDCGTAIYATDLIIDTADVTQKVYKCSLCSRTQREDEMWPVPTRESESLLCADIKSGNAILPATMCACRMCPKNLTCDIEDCDECDIRGACEGEDCDNCIPTEDITFLIETLSLVIAVEGGKILVDGDEWTADEIVEEARRVRESSTL